MIRKVAKVQLVSKNPITLQEKCNLHWRGRFIDCRYLEECKPHKDEEFVWWKHGQRWVVWFNFEFDTWRADRLYLKSALFLQLQRILVECLYCSKLSPRFYMVDYEIANCEAAA